MIINNCLDILSELTEIEKTIREHEELIAEQNLDVDIEQVLKLVIASRLSQNS